jgi:GT2 family glycosyltransferase
METVKISIIIVTYHSKEYINSCLQSIYEYSDLDNLEFEIIIVDNSDDTEHQLLKNQVSHFFQGNIIIVHNKVNGGYGQGNNLGLQYCKGNVIAIMNPDIISTERLFKKTLQHFQDNKDLGLLAYKQLGASDLSYYIRQEFYFPIFTNIALKVYNKLNIFNKKKMFISGAYFYTTKKAFDSIGRFDENIFMYCEESDITQRFLKNKYDIIYDPSKSYIHDIAEREEMSPNGFKSLVESSLYYLKKYNFDGILYLKKVCVELKIKKFIYSLLGNKQRSNVISEHIDIIKKKIIIEKS